ncbi:hypothetical protein ACWDZ8_38360 [Streptomyces sp. NPDC003233]
MDLLSTMGAVTDVGQAAIVLALIALAMVCAVCATVVVLVLATDKKDRPAAIGHLTPVLQKIAGKIAFRRGHQV